MSEEVHGMQHVDEGEWATRPHKTHMCVGEISMILQKRRKVMPLDEASQRLSLEQFFRLPVEVRDVIRAYERGARLAHVPRISELRRAYKEMVSRSAEYDVGDGLWHWEIALHVALARIVGIKVATKRLDEVGR